MVHHSSDEGNADMGVPAGDRQDLLNYMIALRQALYVSHGAAPETHAEALANIMRVIQERQDADHNEQEDEN